MEILGCFQNWIFRFLIREVFLDLALPFPKMLHRCCNEPNTLQKKLMYKILQAFEKKLPMFLRTGFVFSFNDEKTSTFIC